MKKTIKYLQDGEYHYATVKDVGDLEQLKTQHKEDLVTALNELFTTGGSATPAGYDDLIKKVNDTKNTVDGISSEITDVNGKIVSHDEAIAQAKKDLQDALAQFQAFNDEIDQAKKDAETELANAKQSLKDEFNTNLADAQKANQKQLEDRVAAIQGNLDTTSNTLNDVKTQLTNVKLNYGAVNVSIQKLNDTLSTKLSSTDLDPLKTSIQQQETEIQQTKNTLSSKAGKAEFDVLTGRVSTAESKIKQQADEISLGVKKSELNGAIDNYQIEGINRLRNTLDFDIDGGYWKLDQYSINSNTDVHPYDQAHDISVLVLQKAGSAKQDVDFTNEDLGQSFVISMWNKKDAQPQVWYGNTQLTNRQVAEIKGDYERSFFTFIPTNVNVKTLMFKYDAGTVNQLIIGEPKLELGTKPKAYTPNPNDEHKQIVNTKAELKIASDKIESAVEKQTKTDDNVNQLASRVTQTEQGITATNDLITKTKDGLIKDYTGKIDASAKALSSTFEEKTNEKIGQITDSGENLILNSAFTNETDRKDKWQNISDKVNIVADDNSLMWAHMSQSGLTADNPISLTSNYFPIKQGKVTVGVDIKSDNINGLSGAKILVLQTYNANKQRVDFTELSLEDMGLTISQLADGQSHRGVYRLGNDRSDAVYMTVKAVLPRNGSIYFTNFSAKLSSIDNGGYTPNADDLKRQILNQKTKIEQNSQQITLKASSTELRDVRTIASGAVSVANQANSNANTANNNATNAVSVANSANTTANQAKSNANSAVTTANSAVTTANSAKSTADNANNSASSAVNTANNANTTANSAKNKIDAIQTQIGQARTDIQSTLTVANNGITAATNLKTTYDNYVQKNDANIKLLGDRITNEVSKITSNGGGRNLLQGTGTASGDVANGGVGNYIIKGAFNGYDAIKTNTAWDERFINLYSALGRTNAKAGDWFTISVYVKADKQIDTGALDVFRALGNGDATTNDGPLDPIWMSNKPITTQWQQYAWSFQINDISLQRQNTRIEYNYDTGDNWIYWAGWMLEKGTVAHDWHPAPEDTDSAIEAVSSKIDQTATSITSTVNSTKQDLQGQINSANTKITQTANSITEQLKSYSKTGDMQNYVNTTVQKTADGIKSEVSSVESKINNLQIGGTNLLKDTDKMTNTNYWGLRGGQSIRATYGNKYANVVGIALSDYNVKCNANAPYVDYIPQIAFEQGTDYTVSFWTTIVDALTLYLNANDNTDHQHNNCQQAISLQANGRTYNGWKQVTATFKPTVATAYLTFAVSTAWVSSFKLEKGNKATDWQPAPEDVADDISNINTKVEQYKTGINQTTTGMNLFAQVITGNKDIDVTKSNIGIDPNQIKIASNKIVIDGNTSINGTLNVPNVVLKGESGSIDLSGDAINIVNNNSTYGLILKSDGVAVGDKDKFYGLFTSASLDFFMKTQNAPRPYSLGAIEESHLVANTNVHGISITGKPYKDNKGDNYQGGNYLDFGFENPDNTPSNPMIRLVWRDLNNVNNGTVRKGIHILDNIYVDQSATCIFPPGTQDPLMITGLKFSNSTQLDFFQPTLQAGWSNSLKGDSGLTFFWNSVRTFGTLDLTGTSIRIADAEANLEFGWVNWNDWPGKLPALFRRNGNNAGGIAVGGDSNVILFGNGHRWNLNQRNGY